MKPSIADPYVAAYVYGNNNPVRYTDPSGRESQSPSGFCADIVIASSAIFVAFGVLDAALGFVLFFAPEVHAIPPVQALDYISIAGSLGAAGGVVYGATHACEGGQ